MGDVKVGWQCTNGNMGVSGKSLLTSFNFAMNLYLLFKIKSILKKEEEKKNKLKIPRDSCIERNPVLVDRARAIDRKAKLSPNFVFHTPYNN